MTVYEIDPIQDERWNELVDNHSESSVFHTRGWLQALHQTYGYEPVAFTTSPPGSPLTDGVAFCYVPGWFHGRRLVSLPFSDHTTPLVTDSEHFRYLLAFLRRKLAREKWDYVEIRGADPGYYGLDTFRTSQTFFLHKLNLRPSLNEIFENLHKNCVQRKIRRAAKERLTCEEGRSDLLINKFYDLLLVTRRRHGLPAQPVTWFRNLLSRLGEKAIIRVASKDGQPLASILTLRHKDVLVYKYGCSDRRFSSFGGTQLLLWKAIEEAKRQQLSEFDLGRSECGNQGLLVFKDRWGADRTNLTYVRFPGDNSVSAGTRSTIGRYVWSHTPSSVLGFAGRMLYKYMG